MVVIYRIYCIRLLHLRMVAGLYGHYQQSHQHVHCCSPGRGRDSFFIGRWGCERDISDSAIIGWNINVKYSLCIWRRWIQWDIIMYLMVHRHIHHDLFGLQLYLDFRIKQRLFVGNTLCLASRLYEIIRKDVFSDIETGPWILVNIGWPFTYSNAQPSPDVMVTYFQLNPKQEILWNWNKKPTSFWWSHIWWFRLQNAEHYDGVSMWQTLKCRSQLPLLLTLFNFNPC